MVEESPQGGDDNQANDSTSQPGLRPMMMRRTSTRHNGSVQGSGDADEPMPVTVSMQDKASMRRHGSTRTGSMRCDSSRALGRSESSLLGKDDHPYSDPDLIGSESGRFPRRGTNNYSDDRLISAREAAAAQEASEAEAAAAAREEEEEEEEKGGLLGGGKSEEQQGRFSLMDLLEQTDEQMGWSGSSYMMRDEDEEDEEDEEEEEKEEEERSCTVCQVKHKGARSGPCGHSFCRLCSKELRVGNGNCPACNDFNLEIVEVF